MTNLTDKVTNCGMRCNECKSISYKEAREAIEVVKQACIEAVGATLATIEGKGHPTSTVFHSAIRRAIKAIQEVE